MHRGNVILRSPCDDPVLIDWGRAGFVVADAPLEERWTNDGLRYDFNRDIRSMLKGRTLLGIASKLLLQTSTKSRRQPTSVDVVGGSSTEELRAYPLQSYKNFITRMGAWPRAMDCAGR